LLRSSALDDFGHLGGAPRDDQVGLDPILRS
jgi:hypothetical protein